MHQGNIRAVGEQKGMHDSAEPSDALYQCNASTPCPPASLSASTRPLTGLGSPRALTSESPAKSQNREEEREFLL